MLFNLFVECMSTSNLLGNHTIFNSGVITINELIESIVNIVIVLLSHQFEVAPKFLIQIN